MHPILGWLAFCAILFASTSTSSASDARFTPLVRAVQEASPSVVNIRGQKFVAASTPGTSKQVNGMGTGIVIDERGYILTNFHVVDGVRSIQVTFKSGESTIATLIARDPKTDLAIIKIKPNHALKVLKIGTSEDLMIAEPVIAMGNAYGYENTVTNGIVSELHRDVAVSDIQEYRDLIQTNASINPGNSGGPLLNIDGEMIGVNVAVRAGAQNIGFAIPVDRAMEVAAKLLGTERTEAAWSGLQVNFAGKDGSPAIIEEIEPGSPAASLGLKPGDTVSRLGSTSISRALDIERTLLGRKEGEKLALEVIRGGKRETLDLIVASRNGRTTNLSIQTVAKISNQTIPERTWELLGMQLEEMDQGAFAKRNSRYHGGLKVLKVRQDGPAALQGIRSGDVLVGLHRWETASTQDIRYIVTRVDFSEIDPVKFFILRDGEPMTLFGHMRVASKADATTASK